MKQGFSIPMGLLTSQQGSFLTLDIKALHRQLRSQMVLFLIALLYCFIRNPEMQEETCNPATYFLGLLFTVLALARYFINRQLQMRITHLRNRTARNIPEDKIIVAIEPNNFLFKYSESCQAGYSQCVLSLRGWQRLFSQMLRFFGRGHFYRIKQSKKSMTNFLKTLTSNPSIELYLYTTLPLEIAQNILGQLNLLHYFPEQNRRSCHDITSQATKHPIDVDVNTKRVIIVTSDRRDHLEEDSQYFLTVGSQKIELSQMSKRLDRLISRNRDIDQLHNELAQIKDGIESDSQAVQ